MALGCVSLVLPVLLSQTFKLIRRRGSENHATLTTFDSTPPHPVLPRVSALWLREIESDATFWMVNESWEAGERPMLLPYQVLGDSLESDTASCQPLPPSLYRGLRVEENFHGRKGLKICKALWTVYTAIEEVLRLLGMYHGDYLSLSGLEKGLHKKLRPVALLDKAGFVPPRYPTSVLTNTFILLQAIYTPKPFIHP